MPQTLQSQPFQLAVGAGRGGMSTTPRPRVRVVASVVQSGHKQAMVFSDAANAGVLIVRTSKTKTTPLEFDQVGEGEGCIQTGVPVAAGALHLAATPW